jgi:hypothetical protein
MQNLKVNSVLTKLLKVKNFTYIINISSVHQIVAVIYPKQHKQNMFQLNFVNLAEKKLLKQPGSQYIHGLYGEKLSNLFEAIAQFTKELEDKEAQYHFYQIKSKKELNKIPNVKNFWYYDTPKDNLLKLRPASPLSNDLMECSLVHRSETDKFFITPEGSAVHKDAVELVG